MKNIAPFNLLLAVFSLSCLTNNNAFSQKPETLAGQFLKYNNGNAADFLAEQDAVIAAPDNHKILMENNKVRVLQVTLLPGEKEPVHNHRWPSVLYIETAGDWIDYNSDGKIILDTRTLKTPLQYPMTMYKEPEAPHTVENLSKTITIRLIRVEMKP